MNFLVRFRHKMLHCKRSVLLNFLALSQIELKSAHVYYNVTLRVPICIQGLGVKMDYQVKTRRKTRLRLLNYS